MSNRVDIHDEHETEDTNAGGASDLICFSADCFTLLLQRLEKTDEVSPKRGLGRIIALAN